jgi:molecular chaperone GrpE (heat shock protein)
MARGWESKSVESQIEDAGSSSSRSSTSSQNELLTAEQRAIWQKLQDLDLSRRRVLQDLETARSPLRRTALEQALAFLDQEIRKLAPR